jgi:molybdopterin-guanine dinucleotide biosynthesis protein A
MGHNKAILRIGGETFAERAAHVLVAAVGQAIEVGSGHSRLPAVREERPGAGPVVAMLAGADALGVDRIVLLGVDLPRVGAPLLEYLAYRPGRPTTVPRIEGHLQLVCARYGPDALDAARDLVAESSVRSPSLHQVVASVSYDAVDLEELQGVASADDFADIDTEDDLRRAGLRP